MKEKILIVGGYGAVGSSIAENLSVLYPQKIIIAGRSLIKAEKEAEKFEGRVIAGQLDVTDIEDLSILDDVKMVIMCLDQQDTKFVEQCILRGIIYIDISAQHETLKRIEGLHSMAVHHQASIALSVGLAPGITNLLSQYAVLQGEDTQSIDIFILLGLGEKHGDHAYKWTFNNLDGCYPLKINRKQTMVKSFTQPLEANLLGKRKFYLFNFSDQHVVMDTLKVPKVQTRMAFDIPWFTEFTAVLRKFGITRIFKNEKFQNLAIKSFKNYSLGTEVYAVKVLAKDKNGNSTEMIVSGKGEGRITACFATEIARLMLNGNPSKGVLHTHQLITDIPDFLYNLKKYDSCFQLKL